MLVLLKTELCLIKNEIDYDSILIIKNMNMP